MVEHQNKVLGKCHKNSKKNVGFVSGGSPLPLKKLKTKEEKRVIQQKYESIDGNDDRWLAISLVRLIDRDYNF